MDVIQLDPNDPTFDKSLAGATVSWELVDTIGYEDLVKVLKENDISCLPEQTSPASALHRLLCDLYQSRNQLVKPCRNPNKTKKAAYAILPREDNGEKMAFVQSWSVGLESDDRDKCMLSFSDGTSETDIEEVNMLFPSALEQLGRIEQSGWLVTIVKSYLRGVPTIGGSGMYFIGPKEIKTWRKLRDLLKPFGVRLYEIPAMRSSEAIECVIESVNRYTQTAIAEIDADYQKYAELQRKVEAGEEGVRKIQERVLNNRLARVAEQLAVVEKYEKLFETKLASIREPLENLQAGFTQLTISTS